MLRTETSPGTHLNIREYGGKLQTLVTTNVDAHLRKAKLDRDRGSHKFAEETQVMGNIPPVAIMELGRLGFDLLAPVVSEDSINAAMRWLDLNPEFKSTTKKLGKLLPQGAV